MLAFDVYFFLFPPPPSFLHQCLYVEGEVDRAAAESASTS